MLAGRLAAVVGERWVVSDPDLLRGVSTDWTGRYVGAPALLVSPADTDEVAGVLGVCRDAATAVVTQGGNTGLAAGAVPPAGSVVLSTRRLSGVRVDADAGQARVGAGVPVAALQTAALAAGWSYGVDLASRDTATVGGTVATNAGGLRVVAYGPTRAQVLGVEAVLGDGRVLRRLGGVRKEAVGPDLSGLLVGSEGILGVITAVQVRLWPVDPQRSVAVFGVDGLAAAEALLPAVRSLPGLRAVEFVDRRALGLVAASGSGRVAPVGPDLVLVELAAAAEAFAPMAGADPAVADTAGQRARLWGLREGVTAAVATASAGDPVRKLDVALPAGALAGFAARLPGVLAGRGTPVLFGHLAEANLHVNLLGTGSDPADDPSDDVLRLVAALGGVVSSEHGIGRQKAHLLHLSRSPAEVSLLHDLRAVCDPAGILNPGALLAAGPPPAGAG